MSLSALVRPSRKEVWWNNFYAVQSFYKEYGHLTMPEKRLVDWLTYQRYHAKSLTNQQLDALDSIEYKSVKLHRPHDEEQWAAKLNRLVSDQSAKRSRDIEVWLNRQRRLSESGTLSDDRKKLLLEKGIDLQRKHHAKCGKRGPGKKGEERWMQNFSKLVDYRERHGDCNVPTRYAEDRSLGYWVVNQRKKYNEKGPDGRPMLDEKRVDMLNEIGFQWKIIRQRKGKVEKDVKI